MMTGVFDKAFQVIIGAEGGFTNNPLDRGNWTGGAPNAGMLKGTKYGISAAAYPTLDIAALTLDDAKAIYKRDYWDKVSGDALPAAVALCTFDAAVNSGPDRAIKWLQTAARVAADGQIGPLTLGAVKRTSTLALVTESLSQRIMTLQAVGTWRTFGLGWTRRVMHLAVAAAAFDEEDQK